MPASTAAHARHRHLDFHPGEGTAPGIDFLRQALADWHLMTDTAGTDALLVAAELLANAARHTPGPQRLELDLDIRSLRISVTDPAPAPPRPRLHRPDALHGHGLFIVDRLARTWGWRPHGHGKTVWADLPLPDTHSAVSPRGSVMNQVDTLIKGDTDELADGSPDRVGS